MGSSAYALVILGSVLIAFFNVISKKALGDTWKNKEAIFTSILMFMTASVLFLISSLSGGMEITYGLPWHHSFWFAVITTGLLNVGIQYFNMKAKSLEDVSLVVPISASTPAVVIITCMIFLGEFPSWVGWLGIWFLVVGVYILNLQSYMEKKRAKEGRVTLKDWFAPFLLFRKSEGVRWAFASVFLSVFSLPYDGMTARTGNVAFGLAIICSIVCVGTLMIALYKEEVKLSALSFRLPWKVIGVLAILACLWALGGGSSTCAYRYSIVPYVGTLKRLQIPFTILLAYFLIKERTNFRDRLTGGIIIAAGAILIGIS
ncbi:MAG: DMT family transporter [Patescibacteria group bacterium]